MLFNSWAFALFLPIVFALYWLIPSRFRWVVLLGASYWFYMSWDAIYALLILGLTAVSYGAGLLLERVRSASARKWVVAGAAIISLGVLFVFKYYDFFVGSLAALLAEWGLNLNTYTLGLLLPVGVSFYTFQTLSYVIDVYRGKTPAEGHFGIYATFVAFFPQLVAGPIERASDLLPQISAPHVFSYGQATYGFKLMAWGFFKKMVIADTLAAAVDGVYGNLYAHKGFTLVLASVFFAIQIYCDFSGYSDIAVGVGKLFGIELTRNFHAPYFASSLKSFWSRWHISLSRWFRDYLYIPLGGNRRGRLRRGFNLFVTFLVSGLWHGANWTFLVWGGLHGAARLLEDGGRRRRQRRYERRLAKGKSPKPPRADGDCPTGLRGWLGVLGTFAFTTVVWVFFRAGSLFEALYVLLRFPAGITSPVSYVVAGVHGCSLSMDDCVSILVMVLLLLVFDYFSTRTDVIARISALKPLPRWCIYVAFALLFLYLLPVTAGGAFIYFQF